MIKRILFLTILYGFVIPFTSYAEGEISGKIFGESAGIYHPFLSLTEIYSTNIYRTEDDTKSDLTTVITPGIWISVPKTRERLLEVETSNNSPGGLSLSRTKPEIFRRYQGYFLAGSEIKIAPGYSDADRDLGYSDPNVANFKVDGFFQYNLKGGLSFDFVDQFRNSHEPYGLGVTNDLDQYTSNLFQIILSYDITEKISIRTDYSNFMLAYSNSLREYADRSDNILSGYVFYRVKPKTSVFSEIEYMDIGYNTSEDYNSNEIRYLIGINWDITAKSKGSFKTGLGSKNFKESSIGDSSNMVLELKLNHTFTPKTSLRLSILRRTEETTIVDTYFSLVNSMSVEYNQIINEKITANGEFLYSNEAYEGELDYTGTGILEERTDNKFGFSAGMEYKFREWLTGEVSYIFNTRNSNIAGVGYSEHTLIFNIKGSL